MELPVVRGVLFDWRGTLVHDPAHEWWVATALEHVGRAPSPAVVDVICEGLRRAAQVPEVVDAEASLDCSPELHRHGSMLFFRTAGLDGELAEALYNLDFDPASHPFYPDVAETLSVLHERGCRIAVVSDIHFDLRPEIVAAGFEDVIDAFVLSFEHGVQKPDPKIFEIALDALDVGPHEVIMVGDRASHDGGAVAAGITTLLLPALPGPSSVRGLRNLVAFVGG
jgi:HAD superfamily hydrolase (TIGR01509 family)